MSALDDGEDPVEPDEHVQALVDTPPAPGFPPRTIRHGILQAGRPDTRTRRITDTATLAGLDQRAHR